jgi:hypothetical protein
VTASVPAGLGLLVVAGLLSVGGGLVLYALVRAERDQHQGLRRDKAEQLARRDSTDDE